MRGLLALPKINRKIITINGVIESSGVSIVLMCVYVGIEFWCSQSINQSIG